MVTRLALVLLGAYVGVVGAVVHRHRVELLGIAWPWGLALALAVTVVVALAAGNVIGLGASWFTVGWALLLVAQSASPVGSHLVAADSLGWSYTLVGSGCLGLVILRNSRLER